MKEDAFKQHGAWNILADPIRPLQRKMSKEALVHLANRIFSRLKHIKIGMCRTEPLEGKVTNSTALNPTL